MSYPGVLVLAHDENPHGRYLGLYSALIAGYSLASDSTITYGKSSINSHVHLFRWEFPRTIYTDHHNRLGNRVNHNEIVVRKYIALTYVLGF